VVGCTPALVAGLEAAGTVAVVAGSVGNGLARGEPIRLEPPTISGLPPAAVVWSLRTPARLAVRVSEPARVLDDEALAAWSTPAVEQVGQAFNAAIQAASAGQRSRLDAFAAAVRAGAGPAGEREWYEAWRGSSAAHPRVRGHRPADRDALGHPK
jgi:hypothetical protein